MHQILPVRAATKEYRHEFCILWNRLYSGHCAEASVSESLAQGTACSFHHTIIKVLSLGPAVPAAMILKSLVTSTIYIIICYIFWPWEKGIIFTSILQYSVGCKNWSSLPSVTFTIDHRDYTITPEQYVIKVSIQVHIIQSVLQV